MHAAVLHTLGDPPTFTSTYPDPEPRPGHTVVRVTAAPIVPLDLLCGSGSSYFGRPATPYVPGVQGVGIVETSTSVAPGQRVWFATSAGMAPGDGGLAERCLVADDDLVPIEAAVGDTVAAALGTSALAAWMALSWRGGLRAGERVLVLGGGGAVGQVGIGAARVLGADHVVAVARSGQAQQRAREAGADEVVALTPDPTQLAARLQSSGPFDIVLDPVFGSTVTAAATALADGGRIVTLGGASGDEAVFSSALLRSRSAAVLGYTNNALTPRQRHEALSAVFAHAADGAIAVVHETRPLSEAGEVWREMTGGASSIRTVLRP